MCALSASRRTASAAGVARRLCPSRRAASGSARRTRSTGCTPGRTLWCAAPEQAPPCAAVVPACGVFAAIGLRCISFKAQAFLSPSSALHPSLISKTLHYGCMLQAIMLIESPDGQSALLGRPQSLRRRGPVLTCLSGFIEQGESIEEAVRIPQPCRYHCPAPISWPPAAALLQLKQVPLSFGESADACTMTRAMQHAAAGAEGGAGGGRGGCGARSHPGQPAMACR